MLFQNSFTENREPDKNEGGRGGGGDLGAENLKKQNSVVKLS